MNHGIIVKIVEIVFVNYWVITKNVLSQLFKFNIPLTVQRFKILLLNLVAILNYILLDVDLLLLGFQVRTVVIARLLVVHVNFLTVEITRKRHRLIVIFLLVMSLKMHYDFLTDLLLEFVLEE